MGYLQDIDKALIAHGAWRKRLKDAIDNGTSEFRVAEVQVDNRCEFGKWLYGLPAEVRAKSGGAEIQKLHAQFHVEAARILDLALKGKKAEALQGIAPGTPYVHISGQLALLLKRWGQAIEGR